MNDNSLVPKMSIGYASELLGITTQAIHKHFKNLNIQLPKQGVNSYLTSENARKLFKIKFTHKKIAFQIVKGGTGKTTTIHNVGCAASLFGAKVLMVDIDPQGNLSDAFNVNAEKYPVMIDVLEGVAPIQEAVINVCDGIDLISSRIENVVLDSKLALSKAPLHNIFQNIFEEIEDNYEVNSKCY